MSMGGPMPMGSAYGTPYGPNNALMMGGVGSEYGTPYMEGYPPTIARTHSLRSPSVYDLDERDLYDRDRGHYDRSYSRDYYDDDYDRGRSYRDDDYYSRGRRSSSRASGRSRRSYYDDDRYRDYDDYGRRGHDEYAYDPRYSSSSRYRSSRDYYPSSSSRYYSSGSRSGRKREELSVIKKHNGEVKVLRDGQERMSDRVRRMFGFDPKGVNIVRVKRGEQLAAHISR